LTEAATPVEFWFDPGCAYTWRTSRWLADLAGRGRAEVQWRLMSLTLLNEGQDKPEEYWERRRQAQLALRALAAAQEVGGSVAVGRLYSALGGRRHGEGRAYTAEVVREAVAEAGLPPDVVAAVDDETWDARIRESHQEAQERVGTPTGSPVVAVDGGRGFFGPVVVPPPLGDAGDRLFGALRLLSSVPEFSELKSARAPI
jgi:2-hydroxychromene-2-carboxylate isomerase